MSVDLIAQFPALATGRRTLAADQHLFMRGDAVTHMFFVRKGEVELCRMQASGDAAVLQRARGGDLLAEASLFTARYHCDAVATAPASLVSVPVAHVHRQIARDARFAEAVLHHMAGALRDTRQRAEILRLKTVRQRLDAWLAWQEHLPPRGAWRRLAAELGVSPEALYKELAQRRDPGAGSGCKDGRS